MKYKTMIVNEIGECLKEDTELRLNYVVETLLSQCCPDKVEIMKQLVQYDVNVLIARIRGI